MDAYQMEEIKQQLRGFGPGKPWEGDLNLCRVCGRNEPENCRGDLFFLAAFEIL